MYLNNINIMYYVLVGVLGLFVGQIIDWLNLRLPEHKKIFSKEFFTMYLKHSKSKYILAIITAIVYMLLLCFLGWQNNIIYKIELIKYIILAPLLISAFIIDLKLQIIPNRLNLTIFEIGLLFTVIEGIINVDLAVNHLLGGLVGAGIFLIITFIGGLIAGKEAMGFGDVKFMGAIGLFFGWMQMIEVSVIAFFIAAIISILLIITKRRKTNEYIPFGPFIVVATFVVMIVPSDILLFTLFKVFTLGMYQG